MTQTAALRGRIGHVAFYEKPLVKFERLLETYLSYAPRGFQSFVTAMPVWLKDKLFLQSTLRKELAAVFGCSVAQLPPLLSSQAPTIGQRCSAWTAWASGQRRPRGSGTIKFSRRCGRWSFLTRSVCSTPRSRISRDSE